MNDEGGDVSTMYTDDGRSLGGTGCDGYSARLLDLTAFLVIFLRCLTALSLVVLLLLLLFLFLWRQDALDCHEPVSSPIKIAHWLAIE